MYQLYLGNKNYSSWSLRGFLAMKLSGAPFTERMVSLSGASEPNASNRSFSPTGRVPCLHDGATVVWDSLAIAEYLAERHPGMWPADPAARAWARCVVRRDALGVFGAAQRDDDVHPRARRRAPVVARLAEGHRARDARSGTRVAAATHRRARISAAPTRSPTRSTRRSRSVFARMASLRRARRARTCRPRCVHPFVREWEAAALQETAIIDGDEPRIIYRDKLAAQANPAPR